jgi:hypothetical protein
MPAKPVGASWRVTAVHHEVAVRIDARAPIADRGDQRFQPIADDLADRGDLSRGSRV